MGFWNGLDGYGMSWCRKRGHSESDEASCKDLSIDQLISAPTFSTPCLPGLLPLEALTGLRGARECPTGAIGGPGGLGSNQSATPISSQVTMRCW